MDSNESYIGRALLLGVALNDSGKVNYHNEIQFSVPSRSQLQIIIDWRKTISHLNDSFNLHVVCQFYIETAMINRLIIHLSLFSSFPVLFHLKFKLHLKYDMHMFIVIPPIFLFCFFNPYFLCIKITTS